MVDCGKDFPYSKFLRTISDQEFMLNGYYLSLLNFQCIFDFEVLTIMVSSDRNLNTDHLVCEALQ